MSTANNNIWGIHGGRTGDADLLFLSKSVVAMGWHEMGDLSKLKPDRQSFKAKVAQVYANKKPGAIPNYTG